MLVIDDRADKRPKIFESLSFAGQWIKALLQSAVLSLRRPRVFANGKGNHRAHIRPAENDRYCYEFYRDLRAGRVYCVFQGIFSMSRRLSGVELLIRWNHPERGRISPAEFIPILERTPAIHTLGRFVLHEALGRALALRGSSTAFVLSVNVSAAQLSADFVRFAIQLLQRCRLPAGTIQLEITESHLCSWDEMNDYLCELLAAGYRLAIDDFGTGYCNYSRLRQLPAACVKIDRSFLPTDRTDARGWNLLGGMIRMLADLGHVTVVEGVESEEQFELIHACGADFIQGFLLHRPGQWISLPSAVA